MVVCALPDTAASHRHHQHSRHHGRHHARNCVIGLALPETSATRRTRGGGAHAQSPVRCIFIKDVWCGATQSQHITKSRTITPKRPPRAHTHIHYLFRHEPRPQNARAESGKHTTHILLFLTFIRSPYFLFSLRGLSARDGRAIIWGDTSNVRACACIRAPLTNVCRFCAQLSPESRVAYAWFVKRGRAYGFRRKN